MLESFFLPARKLTWNEIYCIIRVWWIGSRGEAADRVKRTLVGVFNLLQRVSGSLILTIVIITVERPAPHVTLFIDGEFSRKM